MIRVLFVLLLLMSAGALAQVFKWVDAEGRTQFSDRPQPEAQVIGVKGSKPPAATTPDRADTPTPTDARLGPYAAFEIVAPESNQTLRQAQGSVSVSLLLDPPLMAGHRIELTLDGAAIPVEQSVGTQLGLEGITFGSHQVYAQIRDTQGVVVAGSPVVTFHLRKPIPPGVLP